MKSQTTSSWWVSTSSMRSAHTPARLIEAAISTEESRTTFTNDRARGTHRRLCVDPEPGPVAPASRAGKVTARYMLDRARCACENADVAACSLAAFLRPDAHAARVAPLARRAGPAAAHRHGVDPGGRLPGQDAVSQRRSPGRCHPAHGPGGTGIDPTGVLFALGAGACWALYIVFGQRAGTDHGAQAVALGSIIASIVVVPVGVVAAGSALLSLAALPYGLAIALLSTALPYTLEMIALTKLPARTFGVLMSIEPAFGALAGWTMLQERLTAGQWAAIILIILASIGTTWTATAQRPLPVPMPE